MGGSLHGGPGSGWRRFASLGLLGLLVLGLAAPSLGALAENADDACCTGVCEDGCCFLSEKDRKRLHRERRERPRPRSPHPVFEAQVSCPDDCSVLPSATPVPAAPVVLGRAGEPAPRDGSTPALEAVSAIPLSWHPDSPRGPPIAPLRKP